VSFGQSRSFFKLTGYVRTFYILPSGITRMSTWAYPPHMSLTERLAELWGYRSLITNLVTRDLKVRHRRSVLGIAWTMLNPLITTLILALVFSKFFGMGTGKASFTLYVITGLTIWNLFSSASAVGLASIYSSGSIIRKVYIPKIVFPVAAVASSLVNFGFALITLLLYMLAVGAPFRWSLLLAVIPVAQLVVFTLGLSMILATLYVYFRDVKWFYDSALLAWFYATPIFYPPEIIGQKYLPFLRLNPLLPFLRAFRAAIIGGVPPGSHDLLMGSVVAVVALGAGWFVLQRFEQSFINYL
jgi:ABC-type polysaccharide/polyol phosphate export permease